MKLFRTLSILFFLCLLLASCSGQVSIPTKAPTESRKEDPAASRPEGSKTDKTEPTGPAESSRPGWLSPSTAETTAPAVPAGPSAAAIAETYRSYLTYLQKNEDTTGGTYFFAGINSRYNIYESVMFWDISGDGLREMLVISPSRDQWAESKLCLRVLTCRDGQVKELTAEGESSVIPVFWDQSYFSSMTDSVCFSIGETLYVCSLRRENAGRSEREYEDIIRLGYDRSADAIKTDKILQRTHVKDYGLEADIISDHWYVIGNETTKLRYEGEREALLAQAEYGILTPQIYADRWYGSQAGESMPIIYENRLGMRYRDAISFLTEAIEAAEEETPPQPEIITLGRYEQDGNWDNGPEPVEWLVLAKEEGKALVISCLGLSSRYYDGNINSTWEKSSIREWLHTDFYNTAFTETEKGKILTSQVVSEAAPRTGRVTVTEDTLFLLSNDEVRAYLTSPSLRVCVPSALAKSQGCRSGLGGGTDWILRTYGGYGALSISYIDKWGTLDEMGTNVDNHEAIRPAMWIGIEE